MLVRLKDIFRRSALSAVALGLLAMAAAPAMAQDDAQRRSELRSSVRKQQSAHAPAVELSVVNAPAAGLPATIAYRQLSEQQRIEMRRQLARDQRGQGKP